LELGWLFYPAVLFLLLQIGELLVGLMVLESKPKKEPKKELKKGLVPILSNLEAPELLVLVSLLFQEY
jgi:hypothetical protein